MRINRHNYEEFFLLYVDKELSAADRKTVDVFVQENPDLKVELQMLQQTVVTADDIVLDKKGWLFMEEDISALQENLLLYADDELNAAEKKSIESLLTTDKTAQAEWNILQQTKLQPDAAVVFADKQSLYKTAGTRVVAFKWWRVAAAALLLGFGIWGGVAVYKNNLTANANERGLVENKKTEKALPAKDNDLKTTVVPNATSKKITTAENIAIAIQNEKSIPQDISKQAVETIKVQNKTVVNSKSLQKNTVAVQNNRNKIPDNNLPKPYFENINNSSSNKTIIANVIPSNNNNSRVSGNDAAIVKTNPIESMPSTNVATNNNNSIASASTNAIQVANNKVANEGNGRYLNLDDDKEKRTGFGGFLRKAKRVIERTTNINTGEGIKIAGFEIALK